MADRNVPPEVLARRRAQRRETRTGQTYRHFIRKVEEQGFNRGLAECAVPAVLCLLEQRLIPQEAEDLRAQLPLRLQELLHSCERHENLEPRSMGRQEMVQVLCEELSVPPERAEQVLRVVFAVLSQEVSEGEVDDVVEELPKDLRALWPEEVSRRLESRWSQVHPKSEPPPAPPTPWPHQELAHLVEQVLGMPVDAQLGFVRSVVPRVLAPLADHDRMGFVHQLNEDIDRAKRGERVYDLRPPPSH